MLGEIQGRDLKLLRQQEVLEQTVAARTHDLGRRPRQGVGSEPRQE